jgi:hypothetical protein
LLADEISIPFLHAPAPCSDVPSLVLGSERQSRREVGIGSAQKPVTLAAWIQEALPGSATPGGSSLPPALGSKLLTSDGVDGRALRAAHCD